MQQRPFAVAVLALFFVLAGMVATAGHAGAASDGLKSVLSEVRSLFINDFDNLVRWAKNGASKPDDDSPFQPQKAELHILALDSGERDAVLSWLRGNGRSQLHAQGASDSDIGPPKDGLDAPTATPTPNPWRNVPLATSSLSAVPQMNLQVLGGFAAVQKDGKAGIVCLSFKNVDPRVAKHVVIEFPLFNEFGQEMDKLVLDRTGEFSPNIDIRSYESLPTWQSSAGPGPAHALMEGCIRRDLPTPALPFLQARTAGYRVVKVEYVEAAAPAAPAVSAPPK